MTNVITRSQISNQIIDNEISAKNQAIFLFNENVQQANDDISAFIEIIEYNSTSDSFVILAFIVSREKLTRFAINYAAHQIYESVEIQRLMKTFFNLFERAVFELFVKCKLIIPTH